VWRCAIEEYENWQKAIDIQILFLEHINLSSDLSKDMLWNTRKLTFRYNELLEVLNKELELNPGSIKALEKKAVVLIELDRYEDALQLYERIRTIDPTFSEYSELQRCMKAHKELTELTALTNEIQLKPENIEAWRIMSYHLESLGRIKEAVDTYNKLTKLRPDDAELWCWKGERLLEHCKRYKEALKAFEKSIELKPDYIDAFYKKASVLYQLRRYKEALGAYDEVLKLDLNHDAAWHKKADILLRIFRYDEALEAYSMAMKWKGGLGLEESSILYKCARVHSIKGNREYALKYLSEAGAEGSYSIRIACNAKIDDAFKSLWDDEDFKRIVG